MKLSYTFPALLMAVQAYSATLGNEQRMRRGTCDSTCTTFQQINSACPGGDAYYECFCKSDNIALLDNCFSCLALEIQTNDALNEIVSGGGFGLSSDSTVEAIVAQGELLHTTAVTDCAKAGFAVVPGSTDSTPSKDDEKGSATVMSAGRGLGLIAGVLALLL